MLPKRQPSSKDPVRRNSSPVAKEKITSEGGGEEVLVVHTRKTETQDVSNHVIRTREKKRSGNEPERERRRNREKRSNSIPFPFHLPGELSSMGEKEFRRQLLSEEKKRKEELRKITKEQNRESIQFLLNAMEFNQAVAEKFNDLWKMPTFKQAYQRLSYRLPNNSTFHFDRVLLFAEEEFEVHTQDMLRTYVPTTGTTQPSDGKVGERHFSLVDVGGRQSERRKWPALWEDGGKVDVLGFVVALDELFVRTEEDPEMTGLEVSLKLWAEVTSLEKLSCVPFVLFLNKMDVFEKKLKHPKYTTIQIPTEEKLDPTQFCVKYVIQQFRDVFGGCHMLEFVTCALKDYEIIDAFDSILQIY